MGVAHTFVNKVCATGTLGTERTVRFSLQSHCLVRRPPPHGHDHYHFPRRPAQDDSKQIEDRSAFTARRSTPLSPTFFPPLGLQIFGLRRSTLVAIVRPSYTPFIHSLSFVFIVTDIFLHTSAELKHAFTCFGRCSCVGRRRPTAGA